MKRKTGEYGLYLTYDDNKCNINSVSENKYITITKKQLNSLLVSLRNKAKKENWVYKIWVCASVHGKDGVFKTALHVHICIFGNPSATIAKWVKAYWHKRYGFVWDTKMKDNSYRGYIQNYMYPQSLCWLEQSQGY